MSLTFVQAHAQTFRKDTIGRDNHRVHWEFEKGSVFQRTKAQIIQEVDETLVLLGITRTVLADRMNIQASAVTQSLAPDKGIQFTTLIRMADALDCDVEVNFVRRPALKEAQAEDV
jgi:DNA-binding Xre family transcriptional regulator